MTSSEQDNNPQNIAVNIDLLRYSEYEKLVTMKMGILHK
jgi:hypothetical protein